MGTKPQLFNYHHLSVKDLIEARDLFHVHLINKKNVVATAIGRYLIRLSDVDANGNYRPQKNKPERTLDNSAVMGISWPCLLVFVEKWATEKDLIHGDATDIIPKTIYMPDGRMIPICVVKAPKQSVSNPYIDLNKLRFPKNLIGGGFPVYINSQGIRHIATVACLVSDGHKYYALTNKHVSGTKGEIVNSVLGGHDVKIGRSSGKSLGKIKFGKLYNEWKSEAVSVNCDAGLIEVDDVSQWKTEVFDLNRMDPMYDLNTMNLTLGLIAEHKVKNGKCLEAENGLVVGYGAVSQKMEGEIAGLFYRYKAVAGAEYVSDFLIAGRNGNPLDVHHGDSGTLWHLITDGDNKEELLQPIALHWGQHEFIQGNKGNKYSYSLSTCLSNICRELDVELVRGWNIDNDYSWGKSGHYKIAAAACGIVTTPKLRTLLAANKENISFTDDGMIRGDMRNARWGQFCALADVPDIIWRMTRKSDDANHFADMDEKNPNVMNGKSLLELCETPANVSVDFWNEYYAAMEKLDPSKKSTKRGALPFRVWQAFDLMVELLRNKDIAGFICVGGTVSHYLGDACQPLHVSYLHHGHHDKPEEEKVHSVYETNMLDRKMPEFINGVNTKLQADHQYNNYSSGKEAAIAVIHLMEKISALLPPEEIISCYNETGGRGRIDNMWKELGTRTIECVSEGCINLALFWESAWAEGNGDSISASKLKAVPQQKLIDLYMDNKFFPSYRLKDADLFKSVLK